ncbi:FAD-dependent oxidoreductase [Paenibacillus sp. NFR01]|uniref:FAD-dependent oxidoreductase n=1 Tax=Paenibacillus sp. NFR01 TaxID=1566279 RepID=UPI0008B70987|nr:FAD-dependent oxidoreductase [Paenibacillus sp. NFR01]SEU19742.1 Pyruvate/2-oxoglutarate dehydrogenase complex, dihydrolipoamide dehydrogenase (E3) component [Paenibacillus sp. NFR01]
MGKSRVKVDALIIGFGKGGKTLAPFLAAQGLKVVMVEKSPLMYGGTCINVGCIPTKALAHQAYLLSQNEELSIQEKKNKYVQAIKEKDELVSFLRAKNFDNVNGQPGVTVLTGTASFLSPKEVNVATEEENVIVEADKIFINTGSKAVLPNIPGMTGKLIYTSEKLMELDRLPSRLAIIGGGYIGMEFASIYAGFGSEVTIIERGNRFLPKEDADIAQEVQRTLERRGIRIKLETGVSRIEEEANTAKLFLESPDGATEELITDAVLVAAGRTANVADLNLEAAGVEVTDRGFIQVDDKLRTTNPQIWAIGDVNGGPQFTYISLDDYRIISDHLFGRDQRTTKDRSDIPYSVFLDPPLSHVGLTEEEALRKGYDIKVAKLAAAASPRARLLKQTDGILKAVVDAQTNMLLGFTMYAADSSEVVNIVSVFMKTGQPYTALRDMIFTHPSMSEVLNDLLTAIH